MQLPCFYRFKYKGNEYPSNTMLVDYFRATKATVSGDGYHELVLSTTDKPYEIRLDEYQKTEDSDEICTSYIVPFEAVEKCFNVINKNKLSEWNKLTYPMSLDGANIVCKFYHTGNHMLVSTDAMPKNGEEVFNEIYQVMKEYVCCDYLITPE